MTDAKHEAPAEGAGERTKGAAELQAELDQLANEYGDLLAEVEALRARSSAPEAREGEAVGVVHGLKADLNTAELPDGTLLYTHPAAPSADKLRIAVEALEFSEDVLSRSPMSTQHWITGDGSVHPNKGIQKIRQALAALKAEGAK